MSQVGSIEKPAAALLIQLFPSGLLSASGALRQKSAMYGLLESARDVIHDFSKRPGVKTVGHDFGQYTHQLAEMTRKLAGYALLEELRDAVQETHELKVL